MGSFLTNLQVRLGDVERDAANAEAILRAHFAAQGLAEAAPGPTADRTILLDARKGWLSVYDEQSESQDPAILRELGSLLSSRLETTTFSVLVHDSDVLVLELFVDGKCVDTYDSAPEYFGKRSKKEKAAVARRPERWEGLLAPGQSIEALRATWSERRLFAEDTLRKTAQLFGLDPERAAIGYEYADKTNAKYVRLSLRHERRPASERRAVGPTVYVQHGYQPNIELSQGMPVRISCGVQNHGGGSRGLEVILAGDAVTKGFVVPETIEIVTGAASEMLRIERPVERKGDRFVAKFDEFENPAGLEGGMAALAGLPTKRMIAAMYASVVHANIEARGGAPGRGTLFASFVPLGNPHGALTHEMEIDARPTPRRPLRASADVEAHVLRTLDGPVLFAQISMDLTRKEAAFAAAPLLERWTWFLEGDLSIGIHRSNPELRPKVEKAKGKGFAHGKRWKTLLEELATESVVEVSAGRWPASPDEVFDGGVGCGFVFGTRIGERASDGSLPALAFWLDTSKLSQERAAAAGRFLESAMDTLMAEHRGLQAVVTRTSPVGPPTLDMTDYEQVCGFQGGEVAMRRAWLTRWLRVMGKGTVWLGRELASRDIDRAALARATTTTEQAGILRVVMTDDDALNVAESALGNVLPSAAQWREAARLSTKRA